MKMKYVWIDLLVVFAIVNVYAFVAGDLAGLGAYLSNLGPWGILASVDLLIALFIGIAWMWRDARRKGVSPTPYVVLTLLTGSLGLLVYLVRYWAPGQAAADRADRYEIA